MKLLTLGRRPKGSSSAEPVPPGTIAALARTLYEQEGKPEGKDWEHWFNAEGIVENNFGYGANHTEHDFTKEDLVGRMKILVQRKDTGEYYKGGNCWTRRKSDAYDFATRQSAHEFCESSRLKPCKIIVHLVAGVADVEVSCHA